MRAAAIVKKPKGDITSNKGRAEYDHEGRRSGRNDFAAEPFIQVAACAAAAMRLALVGVTEGGGEARRSIEKIMESERDCTVDFGRSRI